MDDEVVTVSAGHANAGGNRDRTQSVFLCARLTTDLFGVIPLRRHSYRDRQLRRNGVGTHRDGIECHVDRAQHDRDFSRFSRRDDDVALNDGGKPKSPPFDRYDAEAHATQRELSARIGLRDGLLAQHAHRGAGDRRFVERFGNASANHASGSGAGNRTGNAILRTRRGGPQGGGEAGHEEATPETTEHEESM